MRSECPSSALVAVPQTADEGAFIRSATALAGVPSSPLSGSQMVSRSPPTSRSSSFIPGTWRPLPVSLNAQIEHVSGALRAVLYAAFKVLLLQHLVESELVSTSASELISSHGDGATIGDNLMADDKGLQGPGPSVR